VLWGHDHFARLAALEGDVGGRALMRESAGAIRFVDCDCPGIREDVDTVEDLLALQGEKRH
jgi:molybdenum cofactor cytidylyltransferase